MCVHLIDPFHRALQTTPRLRPGPAESFARYVPRAVVQQITALRGEAQLGVVARDMSYFFCDIEGFTTVRSA